MLSLPLYYSIVTSFYLIRKREHAKYPGVLHSSLRLSYYISVSRCLKIQKLHNKRNSRRITNPLFDGLTDNLCGHFTHCLHFFSPHRIRCIYTQNCFLCVTESIAERVIIQKTTDKITSYPDALWVCHALRPGEGMIA